VEWSRAFPPDYISTGCRRLRRALQTAANSDHVAPARATGIRTIAQTGPPGKSAKSLPAADAIEASGLNVLQQHVRRRRIARIAMAQSSAPAPTRETAVPTALRRAKSSVLCTQPPPPNRFARHRFRPFCFTGPCAPARRLAYAPGCAPTRCSDSCTPHLTSHTSTIGPSGISSCGTGSRTPTPVDHIRAGWWQSWSHLTWDTFSALP
jgi:hypothetical protein